MQDNNKINAEEISKLVEDSGVFGRSQRQLKLFKYLFEKSLDNSDAPVTEFSIAIDVFERTVDFDRLSDSIVRTEMYRLRKNLELFSQKNEKFKIEIPRGSYDVLVTQKSPPTPNTPMGRRNYWLPAAAAVLSILLFVTTIFFSLQNKPDDPKSILPRFSVHFSSTKSDHLKNFATKLENELKFASSSGLNWFFVQDGKNSDYRVEISFDEESPENTDKLLIAAYSPTNRLTWSKRYEINDIKHVQSFAGGLVADLFSHEGFLTSDILSSGEITEERRKKMHCFFDALIEMTSINRFDETEVGDIFDCLNPSSFNNEFDKSAAHSLRASLLINRFRGVGMLKVDSPFEKAEQELEEAAKINSFSSHYLAAKMMLERARQPKQNLDALREVSEMTEKHAPNMAANAAVNYGFYFGDWDKAREIIDKHYPISEYSPDSTVYFTAAVAAFFENDEANMRKYLSNSPQKTGSRTHAVVKAMIFCRLDDKQQLTAIYPILKKYSIHEVKEFKKFVEGRYEPRITSELLGLASPDNPCGLFQNRNESP